MKITEHWQPFPNTRNCVVLRANNNPVCEVDPGCFFKVRRLRSTTVASYVVAGCNDSPARVEFVTYNDFEDVKAAIEEFVNSSSFAFFSKTAIEKIIKEELSKS